MAKRVLSKLASGNFPRPAKFSRQVSARDRASLRAHLAGLFPAFFQLNENLTFAHKVDHIMVTVLTM